MNCRLCMARQNIGKPCPGCNSADAEKIRNSCANCLIRNCGKRKGSFCTSCADYPCIKVRKLDDRYRKRYGVSFIANLGSIKNNGIENFLAGEELKWKCATCGSLLCVHRMECPSCGALRDK